MAENVEVVPFDLEETDKEEVRRVVEKYGVGNIVSHVQAKLTEIDDVTVNIAVTGTSGSGKSTFINTIRGVTAEDEGGAEVGGWKELTMAPKPYAFPTNAKVIIWDLPGLGTTTFTKQNYAEKVTLERYDFFLIFTCKRFTENDLWLAREVKRIGKNFFLVRTHIDEVVKNSSIDYPKTFNESTLLARIRGDIKKDVEKAQIQITGTDYLISTKSTDTKNWDFQRLITDMTDALDDTRRQVLSLSFCDLSEGLIKKKCDVLRARIWKVALVSGAAGAIPLPIVDVLASDRILLTTVTDYKTYLGLDAASLTRLSIKTGKPYGTLESTADQYLKMSVSTTSSAMIKYYGAGFVKIASSVGMRWIPVIGSVLGANASFWTTYALLNSILSDMEKAAIHVIKTAFESNTT